MNHICNFNVPLTSLNEIKRKIKLLTNITYLTQNIPNTVLSKFNQHKIINEVFHIFLYYTKPLNLVYTLDLEHISI